LKKFQDGWGFMNSDAFHGDLFVHARENPEIAKYPPMTEFYFVVSTDSRGKPMATNSAPANPGAAPLPSPTTTIQTGERIMGTLRSFSDHWGFVRTDDGLDYYFHEKSIETFGGELPTVGSKVYFSTAPDNQKPDKVMAVNLQTITPGAGVMPGMPPRKRTATEMGGMPTMGAMPGMMGMMMPGMMGMPMAGIAPMPGMPGTGAGWSSTEELEAAIISLPSARIFQLAEMKMHMEIPMTGGNMNGLM
jgi:cold shock CspA family protein